MDLPVAETEVELTLITRDQEHCVALIAAWSGTAIRSSG